MAEKFFWADAIADQIISKKEGRKEYVCASGISPSGIIHIGNFREVITTDLVVRALKDKKKKVHFIYSWDDFDRFRKVPVNLPKKFEKYIGMPLSDIPAPTGKGKYAEYFEKKFEKSLNKVGIKPKFIQQSVMNKKCAYAKLIKVALEKREEIIKILNKYRKEPLNTNWYPVAIYCEKCKKDSTHIIKVDGFFLEYGCKCGFKHKIDYRKKGIVGIKWRVDWPMRWKYEGVDFEPGGIDHSVEGGSFTTAKEISKKVFGFEPPIYQFYEWINVKGIKLSDFHSSKGNVVTLEEVGEIYEPEIIRYLFVGTRPNKSFQISFDAEVIKIYDEYDMLKEKYYNKTATPQEMRIYELSQVKLSKTKPRVEGFKHLVTLIQSGKSKGLSEKSKERAKKVKNWLEKYAPEDFKFEVQNKIKYPFEGKERNSLIELRESLKERDFTEEELFNEFYEICKKAEIKNTDFFKAAYRAVIGKEKGPRLASLILAIGKDKIINLLEKIK